MPVDRSRKRSDDEDEEARESTWWGLARDLLVAGIIVAIFLGSMYAYTGVWPPLVVVESASMQHSDSESSLGVIDTGDMVFQQAAPTRASVITYLEGRASGYSTYGDYGDVIIFNRPGNPTPVIHRAIMYITLYPCPSPPVVPSPSECVADVPDLSLLTSGWEATNGNGSSTTSPYQLRTVTIHGMGFTHNFGITFDFRGLALTLGVAATRVGYITMGDGNAYDRCRTTPDPCLGPGTYDTTWLPHQQDVIGKARGELPWFGLLKLTLQPTESCCSDGWGDPRAPKNSWDALLVSLIFLFALPFILEYAGRAWVKYVSPRLPEILWPWRRKATREDDDPQDEEGGPKRRRKPPRGESSEP